MILMSTTNTVFHTSISNFLLGVMNVCSSLLLVVHMIITYQAVKLSVPLVLIHAPLIPPSMPADITMDFDFDDLMDTSSSQGTKRTPTEATTAGNSSNSTTERASKSKRTAKDSGKGQQQAAKQDKKMDAMEADRLKSVLTMVTQLALSVARETAILKSILVQVVVFSEKDCKLFNCVKATTKRYHDSVGQMSHSQKQEQLPPHLYVWGMVLRFFSGEAKTKDPALEKNIMDYLTEQKTKAQNIISDKDQTLIPAIHAKSLNSAVMYLQSTRVKVMRVIKSYWTADQLRMEATAVHGSPESLIIDHIFMFTIKHYQGVMKPNQAPKGKLERTLTAWVADVKKSGKFSELKVDEE